MGEIAVGLVFAPGLLPTELLPRTYSTCSHENHQVFGKEVNINSNFCSESDVRGALTFTNKSHELFHMIHHMKPHPCDDQESAWEEKFVDKGDKLYKCVKEVAHLCGAEPNIFSLIGHAGVGLMIFESGMHFDFDGAKKVLPKATVVAVFGTFMPLVAGMLLTGAFGFPIFQKDWLLVLHWLQQASASP